MRFLGECLRAAGHTVCGVRLAGHGTRPEDLESCGWRDWYRSVEDGLEALASCCTAVVAVGLSMGSLLVLRLGRNHPRDVSGVGVLSPALVLRSPWPARLVSLTGLLWSLLPAGLGYWPKGDSDIADPAARGAQSSYRSLPLKSVAELVRLQQDVLAHLREVSQPVLAVQARQDHVIARENLTILLRELPNLRTTVILPRSYHVVTVDVERDRVAEEVLRFVDQVAATSPTRRGRRTGKG